MTEQERIDALHQRVTKWSDDFEEKVKNGVDPMTILEDVEFLKISHELMQEDHDTIMVLLGKSAGETGEIDILNMLKDLD